MGISLPMAAARVGGALGRRGRCAHRDLELCERRGEGGGINDLHAEQPITWLGEVACPTFALYGSESDILDRARELEVKVPGCRLEIVAGSSHSLLTEQSALVRERALAWLEELTP